MFWILNRLNRRTASPGSQCFICREILPVDHCLQGTAFRTEKGETVIRLHHMGCHHAGQTLSPRQVEPLRQQGIL